MHKALLLSFRERICAHLSTRPAPASPPRNLSHPAPALCGSWCATASLRAQDMPKKAKGSSGPGRRGTGSHKSKKTHKVSVRQQFLTRHIDQVWEDVRQTASVHDGKTGPLGTTSRSVHPTSFSSVSSASEPGTHSQSLPAYLDVNLYHVTYPRSPLRRAELDEDVPGYGKNYCVTCSRYFATPTALQTHSATKAHKRRCASTVLLFPNTVCDAAHLYGDSKRCVLSWDD